MGCGGLGKRWGGFEKLSFGGEFWDLVIGGMMRGEPLNREAVRMLL